MHSFTVERMSTIFSHLHKRLLTHILNLFQVVIVISKTGKIFLSLVVSTRLAQIYKDNEINQNMSRIDQIPFVSFYNYKYGQNENLAHMFNILLRIARSLFILSSNLRNMPLNHRNTLGHFFQA